MINKLKEKFKKGFTLIETLVAVLILAMAIAGPLTIASKGLTTALIAKDQTIAYYLAQDAVEYVRFARDTNRLQGNDWIAATGGSGESTNLSSCASAKGCYLDSLDQNPPSPAACDPTNGCGVLYYNPAAHNYNYSNGGSNVPTIFTRNITLTTPVGGNNDEASLSVSVSWSDLPGVIHTITVREEIFNWE